jgi:hypothetical protein
VQPSVEALQQLRIEASRLQVAERRENVAERRENVDPDQVLVPLPRGDLQVSDLQPLLHRGATVIDDFGCRFSST